MKFFLGLAVAAVMAAGAAPALAQAMPSCSAGDPVVWLNTHSNVYHEQGDKYYGHTKAGKYVCKSAADSGGAHLSKSHGFTKKGSSTTKTSGSTAATGAAAGTAAGTSADSTATSAPATGKHHRKKKSSSAMAGATPAPGASAAPSGKHKHHKKGKATPAPSST